MHFCINYVFNNLFIYVNIYLILSNLALHIYMFILIYIYIICILHRAMSGILYPKIQSSK